MKPKASRRCSECKQLFAKAESFRIHKLVTGRCRTEDELKAAGYTPTANGWLHGMSRSVNNKGD
jgi:hypothetical protein